MEQRYNLDISDRQYDKNGILDFYWPGDFRKIEHFRDNLMEVLIPFLKDNKNLEKDDIIKTPLNILFKWFLKDILDIYMALQIKKDFGDDFYKIKLPKKYNSLKLMIMDEIPLTIFDRLIDGPQEKIKNLKILKKVFRFFQINSIKDLVSMKFNFKDKVCVYTDFMAKNIRNNGQLNFFCNFSDFFEKKILKYNLEDKNFFTDNIKKKSFEIVEIVEKIFEKNNLKISLKMKNYLNNFILKCFYFVNFYKKQKNLPNILYIGSSGSEVWGKILSNLVISNGGKVKNFEHGRGDILHDFMPKIFTDFEDVTEFITLNKEHAEINKFQIQKHDKFFLSSSQKLITFSEKISDPFKLKKSKDLVKRNNINNNSICLYVSTAFLGYSGRLRFTIPDIIYQDFQIKLINELKKNKVEILCKPHPQGYAQLNNEFYKFMEVKKIKELYDDAIINHNFDFFITDHIASTSMVSMMLSNKPIILMNFNTPKISLDLKDDLYKSINVIDVEFDKLNRPIIDSIRLNNIINDMRMSSHKTEEKLIEKYYK